MYQVVVGGPDAAPARAERTVDRPNSRYFRLARRHAAQGVIAGIMAILLAAWSFTAALSEEPGWSIAAACACVLAVFISTLETSESLRCMRIAARWERWDRDLNRAG